MAKAKAHPSRNLGDYLHPAKTGTPFHSPKVSHSGKLNKPTPKKGK